MSLDPSRTCDLFQGPNGEQRILAFAKMTVSLPMRGPMRSLPERRPLQETTLSDPPAPGQPVACPVLDTDLWPTKPGVDVVVRGHVRSPGERPVPTLDAGVKVGRREKWVRVFGERCAIHRRSTIEFSPPEPFTAMELTWRRAFGGIDPTLRLQEMHDIVDFFRRFTPEEHPGAYPRNPAGRGWVINDDPSFIDGMALPNFEDPAQLLSAHRLVVRDPAAWPWSPVPAGFGWTSQGWFPRSALLGLAPPTWLGHEDDLAEVRLGELPRGRLAELADTSPLPTLPDFQIGAAPGLHFERLATGEPIELRGFSVEGPISTRLPEHEPEIMIVFDRRPLATRVRLSTLELLPDEGLATLLWVAEAEAPQRLPRRMPRRGEGAYDPLEGVDVLVDGELIVKDTIPMGVPA